MERSIVTDSSLGDKVYRSEQKFLVEENTLQIMKAKLSSLKEK